MTDMMVLRKLAVLVMNWPRGMSSLTVVLAAVAPRGSSRVMLTEEARGSSREAAELPAPPAEAGCCSTGLAAERVST
jgi:hypothetical protein